MLEREHDATQLRKVPNLTDLAQRVEDHGFAIVPSCLDHETLERLSAHFGDGKHALRDLLSMPVVRELAASEPVRALADGLLGPNCFAVKGTLFNKTQESNWKVAWHQDLTIIVQERREIDGFGPWTVKAGIPHVQPPAEIMSRILAVRLHLDESGPDNGPLRVIPGSHREGRLSSEEIATWQARGSVVCSVPRGGALLMRPLLLHASSACVVPKPRRVVHFEFAADELPQGLQWHDQV
jgi:ectoine hydroxylase-related dioxygenase (phytanoyl-CoA dioxygenase family)